MNRHVKRSYLLFKSTSHVMRAEKLLAATDIKGRLVPVPRSLSSQCGVCIRTTQSAADEARRIIEEGGVKVEGVHVA